MALTRHSNESILKKLPQIDVHFQNGRDFVSSCIEAAISDKTYYHQCSVVWGERSFQRWKH